MKINYNIPVQLGPVGKDGKDSLWMNKKLPDGDYGATWAGVIKYCKDLKLDPYTVGWHIEKLFGDKTNTNHLLFAAAVYSSLKKVKAKYYRIKRQRTPRLEDDLHYAIRMDFTRIQKLYYEATKRKKTKDEYKSMRQMYLDIMKKRKSYVLDLFKNPRKF